MAMVIQAYRFALDPTPRQRRALASAFHEALVTPVEVCQRVGCGALTVHQRLVGWFSVVVGAAGGCPVPAAGTTGTPASRGSRPGTAR